MVTTVTLDRKQLYAMLRSAKNYITSSDVPALQSYRMSLDTDTDMVNVITSNGTAFMTLDIPVIDYGRNKEPMTLLAPNNIDVYLSKYTGDAIKVGFDAQFVAITNEDGSKKSKVATLSHEYPMPESKVALTTFTLLNEDLLHLFNRVVESVSDDNIVHTFSDGVFVEIAGNTISSASVDGHTLSAVFNLEGQTTGKDISVLLHGIDIKRLVSVLKTFPSEEQVTLGIHPDWTTFSMDRNNFTVALKPKVDKFPDYRKVIPTSATTMVVSEVTLLKSTVGLMLLSDHIFRLQLVVENETPRLRFSSQTPESEVVDEIQLDTYQGETFVSHYDGKKIMSIINRMNSVGMSDIEMLFTELKKDMYSIVFRPVGDDTTVYMAYPVAP